jgi:dihydrofolate reductase
MRKLIVLSMISLDGVMQAPGGPDEDRSGGFELGGWTMPYFSKTGMDIVIEQISRPSDLLLGRKTYDIFANYWPKADPKNPIAAAFNKATKFVATRSSLQSSWDKTVRIEGDLAEGVRGLKTENGPELQVHGSGNMIQTLLAQDLVDELWLRIFPVTLGKGKKLFAEGTIPSAFELTECKVTESGVIFVSYQRNGEVKTGSFDD